MRPTIEVTPGNLTPSYGVAQDHEAMHEMVEMVNEHAAALDRLEATIAALRAQIKLLRKAAP